MNGCQIHKHAKWPVGIVFEREESGSFSTLPKLNCVALVLAHKVIRFNIVALFNRAFEVVLIKFKVLLEKITIYFSIFILSIHCVC